MFSRRWPHDEALNEWSSALAQARARGDHLVDLTAVNPTQAGLPVLPATVRARLADPALDCYQPEPQGLATARAAVAVEHHRRTGHAVDADDIVLTSGTSESYAHLIRLVADPGDRILVPTPGYPLLEPLAALEGITADSYRLVRDGRWRLDIASLDRALEDPRVRAIVVVQPHHPLGSCLVPDEIAVLEERARARDLVLISDEVFGDFGGAPSLAGARSVTTFVLGGLSKSCGLPQLKLGWIVVGGPDDARARARRGLAWIADTFLSVGTPVQHAVPDLLTWGATFREAVRDRIATHARAIDTLVASGEIERIDDGGGWAAVLLRPARPGAEWAMELLDQGVVVHPGHFYDIDEEDTIVISLIPPAAEMTAGLARVARPRNRA